MFSKPQSHSEDLWKELSYRTRVVTNMERNCFCLSAGPARCHTCQQDILNHAFLAQRALLASPKGLSSYDSHWKIIKPRPTWMHGVLAGEYLPVIPVSIEKMGVSSEVSTSESSMITTPPSKICQYLRLFKLEPKAYLLGSSLERARRW